MSAVFDWIEVSSQSESEVAALEVGQFSHVRLYHLCRPVDVQSYRDYGLRLVPYGDLREQFLELVPDCAPAVVQRVVDGRKPNHGIRRVDLGIDYRYLLQYANHYCVYGSEFVIGLCVDRKRALGAAEDFRQRMKRRGRPTVLAVDVPLHALRADQRESLENQLWTLQEGRPEEYVQPGNLCDTTLSVYDDIPAEWISHTFHPDRFLDVLTKEEYRWQPQ